MRGLYIHIPFCKTICSYCDFPKRLCDPNLYSKYINRLIEELDYYNNYLDSIDTVYIGGGTPNTLPLDLLETLFKRIQNILSKSIENTIELNPELVTNDLAILLKKYNFNRISLGIQTTNIDSIKLLNRHHDKDIINNAFNILRSNGFNNINCDLIFGIPYTNINDIKNDLDFIINLNPEHISYYSLIIEDKTILSYRINKGEIKLLDDDLISDMYDYINSYLMNKGYIHYEISNYSKLGYESKHNLKYWDTLEYIGVGNSASGYLNGIRYTNYKGLNSYFNAFLAESEIINQESAKKEFMMLGLRKVNGISIKEYKKRFNSDPLIDFKDIIDKYIKINILVIDNDNIKIKYDKLFIANVVWSEFV